MFWLLRDAARSEVMRDQTKQQQQQKKIFKKIILAWQSACCSPTVF